MSCQSIEGCGGIVKNTDGAWSNGIQFYSNESTKCEENYDWDAYRFK
jgi:hypothetical protein